MSRINRFAGWLCLALNLLSLASGVLYVISPALLARPNLPGAAMPAALALNALLVYRCRSRWGKIYLYYSSAAMVVLPLGNFLAAGTYAPGSQLLLTAVTVYPAFFGTFLLGAAAARAALSGSGEGNGGVGEGGPAAAARPVRQIPFLLLLMPGIVLAYLLLASRYRTLMEPLVSQHSLFLAYVYLNLTVLYLLRGGGFDFRLRLACGIAGGALFIIFMLPLLMLPAAAAEAEAAFAEAFGEDWPDRIDSTGSAHFRAAPFSLPAYFLGAPPGEYRYRKDIVFYRGTAGVDQGVELQYDLFLPPGDSAGLPGRGAVIIRIHGGAWVTGDKGISNMMPMNKYFASRGYVVCDVQYGLTDRFDFVLAGLGAPESVTGSFTLDDMVRHLGLFTDHLAGEAAAYGADLDSVFFTGGSAGGHLATAAALAMAGGRHGHLFSPGLTVRGYIPFYPANKAAVVLEEIGGAPEWLDVETLVRADSPPCLIYQGTHDGMVPWETARSFRERYLEQGNSSCAVLYMPLGGHASDSYFTGYYNQLFTYYMERFIALLQ